VEEKKLHSFLQFRVYLHYIGKPPTGDRDCDDVLAGRSYRLSQEWRQMRMDHWWNDDYQGNKTQCHFVYHESHMDCTVTEPVSPLHEKMKGSCHGSGCSLSLIQP
jgi:hypothetical protein